MKINVANEKIKRQFLRHLKEALGYSMNTINTIEKSVLAYEDYADREDFGRFSKNRAVGFKNWLLTKSHRGKPLSVKTTYHYLRHLKSFFLWLSSQPGYKSKIDFDSVSYLTLEKKLVREAKAPKPAKYPSLDYVLKLTRSIEINTEIDKRDRALIPFLLLSGMRDRAVSTLPLGCFNRNTLEISQLPNLGVETKFGKSIISTLFRFDEDLVRFVVEWAEYLEKERFFSPTDPLFPRSKTEQIEGGFSFTCNEIEPKYWKGTGSIRAILKTRAQNAGLAYYHPHSFRHAAVHLALKKCTTMEQMKAISQNFGHEKVFTTLMTYGTLDDERVKAVIDSIDFSGKVTEEYDDSDLALALEFVKKVKKSS